MWGYSTEQRSPHVTDGNLSVAMAMPVRAVGRAAHTSRAQEDRALAAAARAALGREAAAAVWAAGRTLGLDNAVALALEGDAAKPEWGAAPVPSPPRQWCRRGNSN
jgi:hypothetical protein